MYLKRLFLAFFFLASFLNLSSQGLKSFKLQNGLQVYVWEDTTQTEVFGMVSVKAGSVDDPENYTGLAHYLEHLMFKGSQTIGAHNWAEERFVYDSIIAKYDERVNIKDPDKRRKIDLDINRLNVRQASLSNQNEFWSLVQSMGGQNLNAGTNYDYTVYYNSFPKNELNRWLELYSSRFINPVFRSFQTELETVYEEYNMYQDNPWDNVRNKVFKNAFKGHPYSRAIIGLPEHLKNPQISQLIKFYETWYVPSNMALILVGDIETRKVARTINAKFSRLPANLDTEKKENEIETIEGREQIKESGAPVPVLELVFNGVKLGHSDEIALEVTANLLSNSSQTGLLDRLQLEGDILGCGAYLNSMADGGRFMIEVVPRFDYNQRRYESHKYVEKLVVQELDKLRNGDVEDDFLETVKASMNRNYIRSLENPMSKGMMISEAFISNSGPERILGYPDRLAAVGYEDISRVVSKYLNDNFLAIHIDASENKDKPDKLEKPDLPETPVSNSKE
jgi:predicted Zn-dependent peptidase